MLRYHDLISFEPIESVIQLREADDKEKAISLLQSYVISDHMADKLINDIFENLQFERIVDNRGMLIVGNYGSGKSHLMSVVSTIAELPESSQYLRYEKVAEKAKEIEGKFKVIRAEFGAVTMSLRDIICHHLEKGLEKMGIDYTFPAADQVTNNKDMLYEMMDLFHEEYPDQGLLLVIDELLDYLRSRNEMQLTLDLGFLRELGEVCSNTRFRFISGVQEMLFDNPKFSFVADSLRRVKERFKETRIVREDIAFVVSERLLKKNEEQKALIREHLSKFTKMYSGLSEEIETYVNMFPIHPAYLEMFERVNIAEKRVALKTISDEIKKLITKEVPEDATGFISFDHYWNYIIEDSSLRSNDRVKVIIDKVNTLKGTIQTAVKRQYKAMAEKMVDALAVFRLTTDDLKTPIGLTSEAMRDKLFISYPTLLDFDDDVAEFLKTTIDAAMKDLRNAASFQFISLNDENGQYYINIDESIPVDELISQRGEMLDNGKLDSYYFDVLKNATEVSDNTYVSGYKIWLHEIPWMDRRVKRQGYLFFGAPNERSTAQPERDFYIYMLQAFEEPKFKDEEKEDEVFFRLKKKNDEFIKLLRLYGGATEMYNDTTTNKNLYKPKITEYQRKLVKWIKEHFVDAYEVVYKGKSANVLEHGIFLPSNPDTLVDLIDSVSQDLLSQWFEVKYSEYPSFRKIDRSYLTKANMHTYVKDALDYLNGKRKTMGEAILDGLVLLDKNGNPSTRQSGYAKWVVELLNQKDRGQVLNQNELIEVITTVQGTEDIRRTKKFDMEPELLVVILGALIQSGEIVVTIGGTTYEAMNFNDFVQLPISDITYFSHIKKPSGLPIPEIQALSEMFDTVKVDFSNTDSLDRVIVQIISGAKKETSRTVELLASLRQKFQKWDGPLFTPDELADYTNKLNSLNEFLQGLQVYNTRAKMVNLKYDVNRIEQEKENLKIVEKLENLQKRLIEYTKIADYLTNARYIVSPSKDWMTNVDIALDNLSLALKNDEDCSVEVAELESLKNEYIEHYLQLHQQNRLNATENRKKAALLQDDRHDAVQLLSTKIDLFRTSNVFEEWKKKIQSLKDCYHLTAEKLEHRPECPHCHFNPREELNREKVSLDELDEDLESILSKWTDTLLTNFNDPVVKESIELLEGKQKQLIQSFIENQEFTLPISIELINAINIVLKGIHQEKIDVEQLIKVVGDGNPITVHEAKQNFDKLLRALVGNNDESRVRLTVKK
ncbi:DUF6079 family protein [Caldibacillus thermoamylovorans]|uniref:DUF6079 family protein n=2 Tax=Bacteria TaxID=2 RepID=UPI001D07C8C6|nr:DUF6079 family protein [Caldibacillus thermoamylovorans]MCB5936556.1 DUF6079 family protein [Bacillus sp. DFI.2.34]MCB7077928.1 DUF6079 family protein [Caldibacillus thermoamylovorans]